MAPGRAQPLEARSRADSAAPPGSPAMACLRHMAKLEINSVVDQVYLAIRERIDNGLLARGQRLHQEQLAAELGVSRTPVREALRRLAAEGRVEIHTNRGARVADIEALDMPEPYRARLVVEPGAAALAATAGLREPQEKMRAAIAAQRAAVGDVRRSFAANREFHLALVEASGNRLLSEFAEHLWVDRKSTRLNSSH